MEITTIPETVKCVDIFTSLELKKDDVVFISSDLGVMAKSCRTRQERLDVRIMIDNLQKIVSEGTLIIPAFTDNLVDGDTFDWFKSKPTTGALSNKVQQRTDFTRTRDPLHSVFVWGKHREEIINREDVSTFGPQSIFAFLNEINAKLVFIDVHLQDSLTFVHHVEEQHQVNYRKPYVFHISCVYPEGSQHRDVHFYSRKLGVRTYLYDLHDLLVNKGVYRTFKHRNSTIHVLTAHDAWNYIVRSINTGPKLYKYSVVTHLKGFVKRYLLKRKGIF